MKIFCKHQYKRIRVVKEEHFQYFPTIKTWLYICEKCGKEKTIKDNIRFKDIRY